MIRRPLYMDKLESMDAPDLVKLLVGVRRCGKSTLLRQLRNDLVEKGVDPSLLIEVDFELPSNSHLTDSRLFIEHVTRQATNRKAYLFVDEVQELENWQRTINGLRAELGLNIYATGSNARMFSGENMTYLSGRYLRLEVFPLSLGELCQFTGADLSSSRTIEESYTQLATEGGFPAVTLAPTDALKNAIVDGIYDSVFMRDIVLRGRIRNEAAFARTSTFILDNIGNSVSANSIANSLKAAGHGVAAETVDNYLTLMEKAHLIYRCPRFDIRGKEILRTNGKYYVVDMGLRQRAIGTKPGNHGHITENIVFLELRRRGFEVYVGTLPDAEVDFVAKNSKGQIYIQVSETVVDPNTLARELKPFEKIKDGYPQMLITKDYTDYSQNGVRHINLYDFLLENQALEQ